MLTDVLKSLKLWGRVFCCWELSTPWSISFPSSPYAYFHVIEHGIGWIKLDGEENATPLASGDLVMVPQGNGHVLSDSPETPPVPLNQLLPEAIDDTQHLMRHGGGGVQTLVLYGSFQFENQVGNPLLSVLPPLLLIQGYRGRPDKWLELLLELLSDEVHNKRPGSSMIITRLSDIVFIQAVRAWITEQPEDRGGWLGALRDPQIGSALGLIHRKPEQAWSVSTLAGAVGMSRSPFAAKFTALVGESPLLYLTRWRMHTAARLLKTDKLTLNEVAEQIGYKSEAAFSKAFKRRFGIAPGTYRRTE